MKIPELEIELVSEIKDAPMEIELVSEIKDILIEIDSSGPPSTDVYHGAYNVIPSFKRQELETKGKSMTNNVTIQKIPMAIVSNSANGKTVIIGG